MGPRLVCYSAAATTTLHNNCTVIMAIRLVSQIFKKSLLIFIKLCPVIVTGNTMGAIHHYQPGRRCDNASGCLFGAMGSIPGWEGLTGSFFNWSRCYKLSNNPLKTNSHWNVENPLVKVETLMLLIGIERDNLFIFSMAYSDDDDFHPTAPPRPQIFLPKICIPMI